MLYQAAQIGHIEQIIQEASRLKALSPRYQGFAAKLLILAEQFDDVEIARLIESDVNYPVAEFKYESMNLPSP